MIGADVEVCLREGETLVPACGLLGGTKTEPVWFDEGNVQEDNVFAEFAINPTDQRDVFASSIHSLMDRVSRLTNMAVEVVSAVDFSLDLLHGIGDQAMVAGCDPDYNAYTGDANPTPDIQVSGLRTCGGHVHIDCSSDTITRVMLSDLLLGVPSVILDRQGSRRRSLYGKAGAFRPKVYGFEYRVLSNFWIKDTALIEWVFNQSCIIGAMSMREVQKMKVTPGMIRECIDSDDPDMALDIINKAKVVMP